MSNIYAGISHESFRSSTYVQFMETKRKEKKRKIKNFLRSLKFIKNNKDFNLGPIIKIDQNLDLVKLNRKEVI